MVLGEEKTRRILEQTLAVSAADQTEVVLIGTHSDVTRFANSIIHQNMAESNAELRVRVILGRRIGVASTNQLTPEGIRDVVESANRVARLSEENHEYVSLPGPEPIVAVKSRVERMVGCSPERRARLVGIVCRKASDNGLKAAGALTTAVNELAVANSLGVRAYHQASYADIVAVAMSDDSSGYAERASLDIADIDAEAVANEAIDRALRSRHPVDLEPGEYEVILEEYAVHDLIDHIASLGFNALAYQEGRTFTVDGLGKQLVARTIDMWDDGLDETGIPLPFDFEGVPKRRVELFDSGRAVGLVYDSFTAGREQRSSTGHALPAPNTRGPAAMNLYLATGLATKDEMIASTRRGVLVTRFHYTNPVDYKRAIITGMTRDGTFLVENGEIKYPLRNLRFTQSYVQALSNVEMIGNTTLLHREWMGGVRAPALKIARWSFQQATLY